MNLRSVGLILAVLPAAGCGLFQSSSEQPFWEVSCTNHPPQVNFPVKVHPGHPRLVFKSATHPGRGRTFEETRRLYATDPTFQAIFTNALAVPLTNQHPAMLATCWIVTGEDRYADAAIQGMLTVPLAKSGEPYYSQIWSHALAYDWLHDHRLMTATNRIQIEAKIAERLDTELAELDDHGLALWHGRSQQANGSMIAALALGDLPEHAGRLQHAAGHYVDCLRALQYTEGWPEGASYWIYNRAGPYAVASDCVMTALDTDVIDGIPIRDVMRKIGLWQVYQFGPNHVFEPYGDSQGSLTLGETGWWELTTDYYARLSRDPGLMAGADYIRNRSPIPYGKRTYYWYAALAYDPTVRPARDYNPAHPELWMRQNLPQAMLFGRDSMGIAFFRGAWGNTNETYATFKAGDMLAHHDHYDTGHFAIQKGGLLAPKTGLYGGPYTGAHRLGYLVQTVSANSLLVLAPDETSAYLEAKGRKVEWSALSGGQRVIRPTGFSCSNLRHYHDMRLAGPHLERADITAFESVPGRFDYIAADITAAYNSTRFAEPDRAAKVSLVTRQFLYLRPDDAFIVFDRVETTQPGFLPKFLLHSLSKPESTTEKQLVGKEPDNGILETFDSVLTTTHKRGRLEQHVLLPVGARVLKIGGPDYCCYVEKDGDESSGFNGKNISGGNRLKPRKAAQLGLWRTEVEPAVPGATNSTRFLNVLIARLLTEDPPLTVTTIDAGPAACAARVNNTVAIFARDPSPLRDLELHLPVKAEVLLLDAVPDGIYEVAGNKYKAGREGTLQSVHLMPGRHAFRLTGGEK